MFETIYESSKTFIERSTGSPFPKKTVAVIKQPIASQSVLKLYRQSLESETETFKILNIALERDGALDFRRVVGNLFLEAVSNVMGMVR